MALITKPPVLDESVNTTELSPRNVADVLAQELSGIASAITGGSDKAPKTDIATVEPTNTASRAYSIGELVYVNGNLYKVITAISIGSTFTVGTNIQSTNVSNFVNQLSTVTSKTILGSLGAKQCGNVVSINGYAKIDSISANTDLTIGNIGDLLPPNDTIRGMCVLCQNAYDSTGDVAYFVVGTNGSVSIRTATARTNWYARVSVTYIAN